MSRDTLPSSVGYAREASQVEKTSSSPNQAREIVAEPATIIVEITKGYNACLCQRHADLFLRRLVVDRCEDEPCEMCAETSTFTIAAADRFLRTCARTCAHSSEATL